MLFFLPGIQANRCVDWSEAPTKTLEISCFYCKTKLKQTKKKKKEKKTQQSPTHYHFSQNFFFFPLKRSLFRLFQKDKTKISLPPSLSVFLTGRTLIAPLPPPPSLPLQDSLCTCGEQSTGRRVQRVVLVLAVVFGYLPQTKLYSLKCYSGMCPDFHQKSLLRLHNRLGATGSLNRVCSCSFLSFLVESTTAICHRQTPTFQEAFFLPPLLPWKKISLRVGGYYSHSVVAHIVMSKMLSKSSSSPAFWDQKWCQILKYQVSFVAEILYQFYASRQGQHLEMSWWSETRHYVWNVADTYHELKGMSGRAGENIRLIEY